MRFCQTRLDESTFLVRHSDYDKSNAISRRIVSQSMIFRLFSCYTQQSVNQCILNRVTVRVRVRGRVTVRVRGRVSITSEKHSHSKCIGLHFVLCSTKSLTIVFWDTIQWINNVRAHEHDMAWDNQGRPPKGATDHWAQECFWVLNMSVMLVTQSQPVPTKRRRKYGARFHHHQQVRLFTDSPQELDTSSFHINY